MRIEMPTTQAYDLQDYKTDICGVQDLATNFVFSWITLYPDIWFAGLLHRLLVCRITIPNFGWQACQHHMCLQDYNIAFWCLGLETRQVFCWITIQICG